MNEHCRTLLEQIGQQLDLAIFPVVHNGGLVSPGQASVASIVPGKELHHEWKYQKSSRSSTGSRQRPQAWTREARAGSAARPRASCTAAPLTFIDGQPGIDCAVQQLMEAYPATRVWRQEEGLWLFVPSTLLPDLGRSAGFVIAIALNSRHVRGWGFWLGGNVAVSWIGPRHTNYPDGSICAFDSEDGTWTFGDSLVTLMDIYSVWAVRQLYLEQFGHWPGLQSSSHPYERLNEFADSEHCSCGTHGARYGHCCKVSDRKHRLLASAVNFTMRTNLEIRTPPSSVAALALEQSSPPPLIATLTGRGAVPARAVV